MTNPIHEDDGRPSAPLFQQVYGRFRDRIIAGDMAPGDRLPASRALAEQLGVSRATVVAAYDQLNAEGFIQGRRGSGLYVCAIGEVEQPVRAAAAQPKQRQTEPPPSGPPKLRAFDPGRPDMRLFPYRQWARAIARAARNSPEALVTSPDRFGDPVLRQSLAKHLAEWRGIAAQPEQILITAGSGDALEICIRALGRPGDVVALEDPGYLPIRRFVESLGLKPEWMPVGPDGAALPNGPARIAMLTPSCQFPLGGAMPTAQRIAFLNWADARESWIIEDDYDSEYRYAGRPIPALASLDKAGRSLYIGSFSKVFSDALRLGYLVIPEPLIPRFTETLRLFGVKASIAGQRALGAFIDDGEFYRHIRRTRRIYGERRAVFLAALQAKLGAEAVFTDHQAGMQIAVHLPGETDDKALAAAAQAAGIGCMPLSDFSASGSSASGFGGRQGLLLGYCAFTPEEIAAAMDRLAGVIAARRT